MTDSAGNGPYQGKSLPEIVPHSASHAAVFRSALFRLAICADYAPFLLPVALKEFGSNLQVAGSRSGVFDSVEEFGSNSSLMSSGWLRTLWP